MTKFIVFMAAAFLIGSAPSVLACATCAAHSAKKVEGSAKAKDCGKSKCCAKKIDANILCGGCGQVKGSDVCCAKDAEMCKKCDFVKGSPACCKVKKTGDKVIVLCKKCENVKGSKACRAEGKDGAKQKEGS